VSILLTEKLYFYALWICKMYIVLWIWTDHMMKCMFWIIWLVSIMFKLYQWCLRNSARVKSIELILSVKFCDWDLNYTNRWEHVMLKLFVFYETMFWVWEHVMLKLFRFYEETKFWMISKCWIKCWICLVLRERDLATAWFQHDTVVKYILVKHRT